MGIFPTLMKSVYASLGILSESATSQLFKKYEFRSQQYQNREKANYSSSKAIKVES